MVLNTDFRHTSAEAASIAANTVAARPAVKVVPVTQDSVQTLIQQSLQTPVMMVCVSAKLQDHQAVIAKVQRVAARFPHRLIVAEFDAQAQPMLAQQLGVMQMPVIKLIFQGQVLADIPGAEAEPKLVALLERIVGPAEAATAPQDSAENWIEQIEAQRQQQQYAAAQQLLDDALKAFPKSKPLQVLRGHLYLDQQDLAAAEAECKSLGDKDSLVTQLAARLWWLQQQALFVSAKVAQANSDPITSQFMQALTLALNLEYEQAYAILLQLFQQHASWQDGLAKQALMQLMALVGTEQPLAKQWRRQVFSMFH
jgi:putative thioredoxin